LTEKGKASIVEDESEIQIEGISTDKKGSESETEIDDSIVKALEMYRKVYELENGAELSDKQLADLDKKCEDIKSRKIIDSDMEHVPQELKADGKILMGPPILTRFEKARIVGARALQLSLGAPMFISIPKNTVTSLDIAMEELDQQVIPISIRRVLPNGDFQNIPLFEFKNEL
tara:strand:+ start:3837 stop:4358 length:522 start_codon:yes stop_codon:yes gene_type:complete